MSARVKLSFLIFITLMLSIIPLPVLFNAIKPNFVLLLILYVQFYLPRYFNLLLVLFISLMLDVLMASVIGEHAFALLLTTWFISNKTRRFVCFPQSQQTMLIFLLTLIYQSAIYSVEMFLGNNCTAIDFIGGIIATSLCWMWAKLIFERLFIKEYSLRS